MSDAKPPAEPGTQPPLPFDEAPRVEPVLVAEPLGAPAAGPATMTLDTSDESATAALYRAAIGPVGATHYAGVFARFEARDRAGPHWNWAACLCTLGWMLFRRMTGAALVYAGLLAVAGGMVALWLGMAASAPTWLPVGAAAMLLLTAFVVPGVWGDAWLFGQTRRRMAQALARSSDWNAAVALLEGEAVGRARALWLSLLYLLPLGGAAALYLAGPAQPAKPPVAAAVVARAPVPVSSSPAATLAAASAPAPAVSASAAPGALAAVAAPASAASAAPPATAAAIPTPAASVPAVPAPMQAASALPPAVGSAPAAAAAAKPAKAAVSERAEKTQKTEKTERPPKKAPAAPPEAAEGRYQINVGLFAVDANAQAAYARLRNAGLPATLQELETPQGRRLRVRAGPFGTRAKADAAAVKIRGLGLDAVVVRPGPAAAR